MAPMTDPARDGSCLCGAVRYSVTGPMRDVIYCHCEQCRKTSGHFVAATACAKHDLIISEERGLTWFKSSDNARRGFCCECGSSMFWEAARRGTVSIMAGTLNTPTRLTASGHIFVESAGDYYDLDDGLPQSLSYEHGDHQDNESEHQ